MCVRVHVHVCVCSQASCSRATLSCDSSYFSYWQGTIQASYAVMRQLLSNVFSSETAWPIKAKFYVEPPLEGGAKVCINGPGHMTKQAAMPIYGKKP